MKKADLIAVIFLFLAVWALFLPALIGWRGIFHDDVAMDVFPWQYYLARHMKSGVIPLWDSETWCGAKPFYARFYADTYYLPLWPFLLLSRLDDLDQAYLVISLIPLLLHYALAAIGMYALARLGIRLRPFPAFIAAWVYLFSPAFSYSYVWPPVVNVQAWLPWFLLAVVLMDRGAGFGRVAAGGCIFALMLLAAQPPHVGYGLLLGGLLALGLGLRWLRGKKKLRFFRAPLQLGGAVLLGLALSAVFWVSALDGSAHTELHLEETYEAMTGGDGSMPPIYLATIFIPDLFGTVSGLNNRNWVDSITQGVRFWDANLGGGLLLTFLALAGVLLVVKRARHRRLRFWAIFACLLWIFSVLLMLGRHAPFYYLFYKGVPILSLFPFPIRYRLLQVIATSWLAGLGMEYLISGKWASTGWPRKLICGYLALAFISSLLALFGYDGVRGWLSGSFSLPGLNEIIRRDNLEWFIKGPVLYFVAAGCILVLTWRGLRGMPRAIVVAALVILEASIFTFAAFYFCTFRFHDPRPEHRRSLGPRSHPMVQRVLGTLAALRDDSSLRWATDQPFHDNFAYLEGSFAFMGYDMKPLERRFRKAFEETYGRPVDWPLYWEFPRPIHPDFLSNMSVGCLLDSRPATPFPGGRTEKIETRPDFYLHRNPGVLPRAFTLDRVVRCSEDEAMEELVKGDLRKGVFIDESNQLSEGSNRLSVISDRGGQTDYQSLITDYPSFNRDPASIKHFNELQAANPITRLNFSNPNRMEIDVEITRPAMLVLTEVWYPGWEARVDGEPVPLYRVNYLQRGVWLEEGTHHINLVFSPPSWKIGAVISAISWGMVILGLLGWGARKGFRDRQRGIGKQRP
ncbi:MAG: YfhO family protein [PVC group bacterium]